MEPVDGMRITITKNGPYIASGLIPMSHQSIIADDNGESREWVEQGSLSDRPRCGLCRCGQSGTKPLCDGSHLDANFDGTETATATLYKDRAVAIPGPTVTLFDVPELCSEARFCHRAGGAWHLVAEAGEAPAALVVDECANCPSGRYTVVETSTGDAIEPEFAPSLVLVEDPQIDRSGPIWVRGGIQIESADGELYEVRNRVTLCRCGKSSNKPFCDGTHIECGFRAHD